MLADDADFITICENRRLRHLEVVKDALLQDDQGYGVKNRTYDT